MKTIAILVIMLISSVSVYANETHFKSDTGLLFIPLTVVDGGTYYENVNILLDQNNGTFSILSGNQIPMPDGPFRVSLKFDTFAQLINQTEIRFVNVASDSRCPTNVQCVSAGEATVLVYTRAEDSESVQTFSLSLSGNETPNSDGVLVDGIYFRLLELNPHPVVGQSAPGLTEMDIVVEYSFTPF